MKSSASSRLVCTGPRAVRLLAGAIAALLAGHSAQAAAFTWTQTAAGTTYEWPTTGQDNWGSGVAGLFPNAIDDSANLAINLAGAVTIGLNQPVTLGTLNLGDNTSAFFATTLQNGTGGSLTFDVTSGSAAITKATAASTSTDTISATLTLNDSLAVTNAATAATGALTLSGNIGEGTAGRSLTKLGVGTLVLSGTNSYTGGTVVNSGVLQFGSAAAIAGSGRNVINNAVVAAGYAIDNSFLNRLAENSTPAVLALAAASSNALDFSSSTGATLPNAYLGATGSFTYSGTLTPGGNGLFLGGGGASGSGSGTSTGSSILTVSSVLGGTSSGLTVGGNVTLNSAAVHTFTGGVKLTTGGMVGAVSATLNNPNALTLNFANMATPTNLIDPSNVLTLGGGRLHLAGKNSTASSQTFASTTLSANTTSIVSMTVGTGTATVGVTLGAITRNPGSSLFYEQQNGTPLNGTTLLAPTAAANDASGILGTWAFGSNAAYATNNGSGQIVPYAGATAATGADLSNMTSPATNYSLATVSSSTLTAPITGNTLLFTTTAYTLNNAGNSITLNGMIAAGSGANNVKTISGAGSLVIGANQELVINVFRPLVISCPIVDNPAGQSALTYTSICTSDGGYALTFGGAAANTYTGTTTVAGGGLTLNKTAGVNAIAGDVVVSSGALIWNASNQIADTSNLTLLGTGKVSGTPTETVASVTTTGNAGGFAFGSGTNFTITGTLSMTGNNGPGAVTASSYGLSGTAAMTVGSLSLNNASYYVGSAAANTPTLNLNGDLTGANTSLLNTSATTPNFVLKGTATHNHNFNITSGTTTIAVPISETAATTGSLTKNGSGTLALTGTNTYSGDTTVTAGILAVNGSSIKDTDKLIITGGKVQSSGTEVVDTLFFGASQQAAGTWGATGSGAAHIDDTRFTGTAGVVSVANGPVGGYDAWAATNAPGETADLDHDHDGVANGVEYFMGIGPSDPVFTPTPSVVNGKVTWPHSAAATGITFRVVTSEDLTTWTDVTAQATDAGGFLEYVLPTATPRLFVRLEVVVP